MCIGLKEPMLVEFLIVDVEALVKRLLAAPLVAFLRFFFTILVIRLGWLELLGEALHSVGNEASLVINLESSYLLVGAVGFEAVLFD